MLLYIRNLRVPNLNTGATHIDNRNLQQVANWQNTQNIVTSSAVQVVSGITTATTVHVVSQITIGRSMYGFYASH
jgi:hypothetical protein